MGCVDVTLEDMVECGLGNAGEWLDSIVMGFSNLNESVTKMAL